MRLCATRELLNCVTWGNKIVGGLVFYICNCEHSTQPLCVSLPRPSPPRNPWGPRCLNRIQYRILPDRRRRVNQVAGSLLIAMARHQVNCRNGFRRSEERGADERGILTNKEELSTESPYWLGGEIPFPCNDTTYAHVIPPLPSFN